MDKIEEIAKAVQKKEGWFSGSVSFQCNNPGNILFGPLAQSLGASGNYKSPNGLTYAVWPDYDSGFYALKVFLMLGFSGQLKNYSPDMTLAEFFKTYSGGGDSYGQFVADETGIPVDTQVKYIYDDQWDTNHPQEHHLIYFCQQDYQDTLGTGGAPIAKEGCLETSVTMGYDWFFNASLTPADIVKKLSFDAIGELIWSSLANIGLKLLQEPKTRDDSVIKEAIANPNKICVLTLNNGAHWVLALDADGTNYDIADPWTGKRGTTASYKNISGCAVIGKV